MGGYALLNGSLRYRYSKLINIDFTVNNAGGKNYELAQGYNQARREYGVTVKLLAF